MRVRALCKHTSNDPDVSSAVTGMLVPLLRPLQTRAIQTRHTFAGIYANILLHLCTHS